MSRDDETHDYESFDTGQAEFVPAFFAQSYDEAEEYCELLSDHDIPARAGVDDELAEDQDSEHRVAGQRGMTHGVPVLVPESLLDEASEVIADREDFPDFQDEDEEEEDEEDEAFGLDELHSDDGVLLAGDLDGDDGEEEDDLFEADDDVEDLDVEDDEDEDLF